MDVGGACHRYDLDLRSGSPDLSIRLSDPLSDHRLEAMNTCGQMNMIAATAYPRR
jgi:hypothetical protein